MQICNNIGEGGGGMAIGKVLHANFNNVSTEKIFWSKYTYEIELTGYNTLHVCMLMMTHFSLML